MQEAKVVVNKRLQKTDSILIAASLGRNLIGTVRYCLSVPDRYRTVSLQCYDDYAITWLTDRTGRRLRPVYTSYDDIHAYPAYGRVMMTIKHPEAHLICTAINDRDYILGSRQSLLSIISTT